MKKVLMRKISIWIVSCMAFLWFAPLTSYAFSSANFWFNSQFGKLSGGVYTEDPTHVVVKLTNGDSSVTELTYSDKVSQYEQGYDDENHLYWGVNFFVDATEPHSIEVTEDGSSWTSLTKVTQSVYETSYFKNYPIRLDAYRISANQKISTLHATTFVPANTELFTFTPADDDARSIVRTNNLNAIEFNLGASGMLNWSNLAASDFVLKDVTDNEIVEISGVQPVMDLQPTDSGPPTFTDSTRSLIVKTASNLVKNHTYSLATSTSAGQNEIHLPTAGNYNLGLFAGTFESTDWGGWLDENYEFVIRKNAKFFDEVAISASVPPLYVPSVPVVSTTVPSPGELAPTPTQEKNGDTTVETYKPSADDLKKALEQLPKDNPKLIIRAEMKGEAAQVVLPAVSLDKPAANTVMSFDFGNQTYDLPIQALDLNKISAGLQADLKDVSLKVIVTKQTGETAKTISNAAMQSGGILLSDAIEFTVIAEANGKKSELNDFGKTYVSRSITVDKVTEGNQLTGVTYDPSTKTFRFVPTIVSVKDDKTIVTLKRTGNSIYAVMESKKTFSDISSHWAKNMIELLASKLIVQGVSEDRFAPENTMTRAEFTALLVRSLGLTPVKNNDATYSDVSSSDWYYGEIEAAVKAGLVSGKGEGKFGPNDILTREQAAVMTAAALKFAGKSGTGTTTANEFKDAAQISGWAKNAIGELQISGIVSGMPNGKFEPQKKLNRAEAVSILNRFLKAAELIN